MTYLFIAAQKVVLSHVRVIHKLNRSFPLPNGCFSSLVQNHNPSPKLILLQPYP